MVVVWWLSREGKDISCVLLSFRCYLQELRETDSGAFVGMSLEIRGFDLVGVGFGSHSLTLHCRKDRGGVRSYNDAHHAQRTQSFRSLRLCPL